MLSDQHHFYSHYLILLSKINTHLLKGLFLPKCQRRDFFPKLEATFSQKYCNESFRYFARVLFSGISAYAKFHENKTLVKLSEFTVINIFAINIYRNGTLSSSSELEFRSVSAPPPKHTGTTRRIYAQVI